MRAARRELGTFRSLKVNNLFLFIALMVWGALNSGVEPKAAEFLILALGLLLLFPLSSDPLALVPANRRSLWPLTKWQQLCLRVISLVASPIVWLAFVALVLTARWRLVLILIVAAAAAQLVKLIAMRLPRVNLLRFIPQFPGKLGGIVRNDLREMLSVLDPYVALLLAIGGSVYREPSAMPMLSILVGLTLSTYAQCLFGLDVSGSAMTRYRLLPLSGWEILLAKDIAFFIVLTVLVLPLNLITGWTFGLTALAVGHWPSVTMPARIYRWRFTGSRLFPGVVQGIVSIVIAFAGLWPVAIALYAISLFVGGRAVMKI